MNERKIIIFTALEVERRAVERTVAPASRPCITPLAVGIRAVHGPIWNEALDRVARSKNTFILVAGLGGGLDPTLRVGDVVIDGADETLRAGLPYRFGAIHTSDDLICTANAKGDLFRSTGALAVDMETALIRKAAMERGLSVIGVRAISDTAQTAIDPSLLSLVDEMGRPQAGRIALALMARPARALALHRLGRDTRLALAQLGIAMRQIVDRLGGA